MVPRLLTAVLVALLLAPAAPAAEKPRSESTLDGLLVALDLEKRGRAADLDDLEQLTAQIGRAADTAAQRRSKLLQSAREPDADAATLADAEEAVLDAEARLRAAEERRRALSARLVDRSRRIAFLADEIAKRRSGRGAQSDPVTGRWEVAINPGGRKGVLRLGLDGTIVSGDYVLDGGFRGSFRGTYVADKLTLQRIDSERGFDATFYGKLNSALRRITGTWEATAIAPVDGPAAGTWSASFAPERDETGGDRP